MRVSLLVALDLDGCIGKKGNHRLQWRQAEDMKRFRALTTGQVVIMGYNTFASLDFKPLPNRVNIVISRAHIDELRENPEILCASSLEKAISLAKDMYLCKEAFIIGGALVYNEAIEKRLASRYYLTIVKTQCGGDAIVKIPDFAKPPYNNWEAVQSDAVDADEKNEFPMIFFVYEERK